MNVLHVFKTYMPDSKGGIEEVIKQICLNTLDSGVVSRVYGLTPFSGSPLVVNNKEAMVYRNKLWFKFSSCDFGYPHAFKLFKEQLQWADLVHYHFPWPFADLLHFFSNVKKPMVITYHSDIVKQRYLYKIYYPLMDWFLKQADSIVATSPNYFKSSCILEKHKEKVDVIPIGINPSTYPAVKNNMINYYKEKFGKSFFLFVGVLRYYKGLHILIKAMKSMTFNAVIAGTGPERIKLECLAKKLNLKNVFFVGFVSEQQKIALLKACRAVVFPSHLRSEAFGISLLEGAMLGKPLISSEIGTGTTYINKHKKTGLVIQPKNVKALQEAMIKLNKDEEYCEILGASSKKRFDLKFSGKRMGASYYELYKRIISAYQ